jgi:hypothetical protein
MSKNVYLIKSEDTGFYKIGVTKKNPMIRLKELQTGNPHRLLLIDSFISKFGNKLEKTLHRKWSMLNESGEWFILEESDVKNFVNICKKTESNFTILKETNDMFEHIR